MRNIPINNIRKDFYLAMLLRLRRRALINEME